MKQVEELIPWKVTDISVRPFEEMWSFNPSIHFDGTLWRCVVRCSDYAMPNGVTIRSRTARPAGNQTKNAMVIFDPQTWRPSKIYKMLERDDHPRVQCANVGYEDMRIFRTDRGGLQGIAASLHLERRTMRGLVSNQPPEQVLLSFDEAYNIVGARPIRGDAWSGSPQKNWVPFDHCAEPRFLYSIDRGTMFDDQGALQEEAATVRAASKERVDLAPVAPASVLPPKSDPGTEPKKREKKPQEGRAHPDLRTALRGSENTQVVRGTVRGRRVAADTLASRPSDRRSTNSRDGGEASRVLSAGRAMPLKYAGLRGGTQLVRVAADAWLGIGHEMQFLKGRKYYWHTWYLVDGKGKMHSTSVPMKFASNGIEFAAGMAIDGDRVVVSFGVDDMECRLGETRLSAVLEILRPVVR